MIRLSEPAAVTETFVDEPLPFSDLTVEDPEIEQFESGILDS